jgi:hypothetical protein
MQENNLSMRLTLALHYSCLIFGELLRQTFQPSLVVNKREKFVKMLNVMRPVRERERERESELRWKYKLTFVRVRDTHTVIRRHPAVNVLNYTVCWIRKWLIVVVIPRELIYQLRIISICILPSIRNASSCYFSYVDVTLDHEIWIIVRNYCNTEVLYRMRQK